MTYDNWKARNRAEENHERPAEDDGSGDEIPIVTHHVYPPIPMREFDWSATRDGYEPGDAIGWGKTEAEAIADLHTAEDDAREDRGLEPDLIEQIRRSRGRMKVISPSNTALWMQAAADELNKIFAAYDRDMKDLT